MQDPIGIIIRGERTRGMVEVEECLPSKCKALSSNTNAVKKKEKPHKTPQRPRRLNLSNST
jgi:hypothetical protein